MADVGVKLFLLCVHCFLSIGIVTFEMHHIKSAIGEWKMCEKHLFERVFNVSLLILLIKFKKKFKSSKKVSKINGLYFVDCIIQPFRLNMEISLFRLS